MQWQKDNCLITDDVNLLDKEFFISSLQTTYWAEKRSKETIEKSLQKSIVLSLFADKRQIGFVRIIGDDATFAYICDFYIHPDYRKLGLGKWFMQCIQEHPATQVRLNLLATRDAHGLYEKFGYKPSPSFMGRRNDDGELDTCLGKR